jgi:hypothetical protein
VAKEPRDLNSLKQIQYALSDRNIILMDYDLHEEITFFDAYQEPIDGLELLERIEAVIRRRPDNKARALAIFSGKTSDLAQHLGCTDLPFVLAAKANIDWVFEKGHTKWSFLPRTPQLLSSLSAALERVEGHWADDIEGVETQISDVLGLSNAEGWRSVAHEQIRDAYPPLQSLTRHNDGTLFVRWLLQVVLPFPGPLIDLRNLAVSLRIQPQALESHWHQIEKSELRYVIEPYKYTGILNDFMGVRFWRAGIQDLAWELRRRGRDDGSTLSEFASKLANVKFEPIDTTEPVLTVDCDFRQTDTVVDINEAVQIQPDEWPVGVEMPFVKLEDVENDSLLKSIVVARDLERVR